MTWNEYISNPTVCINIKIITYYTKIFLSKYNIRFFEHKTEKIIQKDIIYIINRLTDFIQICAQNKGDNLRSFIFSFSYFFSK